MCQQKIFKSVFKIDILCDNEPVTLTFKRKGISTVFPIGMHITFGKKYDVEITGITAVANFDIITYKCQIYRPLTLTDVNELLKVGWSEYVKQGTSPKLIHSNPVIETDDV